MWMCFKWNLPAAYKLSNNDIACSWGVLVNTLESRSECALFHQNAWIRKNIDFYLNYMHACRDMVLTNEAAQIGFWEMRKWKSVKRSKWRWNIFSILGTIGTRCSPRYLLVGCIQNFNKVSCRRILIKTKFLLHHYEIPFSVNHFPWELSNSFWFFFSFSFK